mmetsp:Transcript_11614/g.26498  ORF Transcript_11614/g.26498 Transcript_11614/m.26498 type:complete len:277 (+) Transcript_11614:265-1095(+)
MLSPPMPLVRERSGERQWSIISSMIVDSGRPARRQPGSLSCTKSTASWFPRTSHMPSQATIMNSSLTSRLNVATSGVEQIICSHGGRRVFFLYSRSPIDRERFRLPFTRYCTIGPTCRRSTLPPAWRMRSCSDGRLGLWSSERGTACLLRESTARLSPALATMMTSGRTRQTTQVQPTQSGFTGPDLEPIEPPPENWRSASLLWSSSLSISSIRWKADTREERVSELEPLVISPGRYRSQKSATSLPPWPSMTPKAAVSPQPSPSSEGRAKCASSI